MTADLSFDEDDEPIIEGLVNYKDAQQKRGHICERFRKYIPSAPDCVRRRVKKEAPPQTSLVSKQALKGPWPGFRSKIYGSPAGVEA